MSIGYKDKHNKFHPISNSKGVRKKRNKSVKTEGVRIRKRVQTKKQIKKEIEDQVPATMLENEVKEIQREQRLDEKIPKELSNTVKGFDAKEWEDVARSKIKSVKEEKFEGMNVIAVKFENGEEWFEFKNRRDENDFIEDGFKKAVKNGKLDDDPNFDEALVVDQSRANELAEDIIIADNKEVTNDRIGKIIDKFNDNPIKFLKGQGIPKRVAINDGMLIVDHESLKDDIEKRGELLPIDHPKIESYTDLLDGGKFFREKKK